VTQDAGLAPALEAGIVELDGSRIRFTHPLLAAGVLEAADPRARADIHGRLAELLEDPEARAWQLAACRNEPDESVAAVLEEASVQARARGAPRPAALLLDRAAELTPADGAADRIRRSWLASVSTKLRKRLAICLRKSSPKQATTCPPAPSRTKGSQPAASGYSKDSRRGSSTASMLSLWFPEWAVTHSWETCS
jgi:hypothetical protein